MRTSKEILEEIACRYRAGILPYRDHLLQIGRDLHEFIVARLREGMGITDRVRRQQGITREQAIMDAAAALKVDRKRVRRLVTTAHVAELLAAGQGLGELGHVSLYRFYRFIHRPAIHGRCGEHYPPDFDLATCEKWEIRPGFEESAPLLFRKAVAGNWTQYEVEAAARELRFGTATGTRRRNGQTRKGREEEASGKEKASAFDTIAQEVAAAAPGDVAEFCMSLVEKSASPLETCALLAAKIEVFRKKRKSWVA